MKSCGKCKPNTYENNGDITIITVANGRSFIIDSFDFENVSKHSWYISVQGYATTTIKGKLIRLHNYLKQPERSEIIDHINRNKLDNTKDNLRKCTKQQNCFNQSLRITNTTGFKGVTLDKRRNTYFSRIMHDGVTYHLGTFKKDELIEAAKAYNQKAIELFDEYAFLNPI